MGEKRADSSPNGNLPASDSESDICDGREDSQNAEEQPSPSGATLAKESTVSEDEGEKTPEQLETPSPIPTNDAEKKKRKRGVIYISRVPPGMDIGSLRGLLSRAGSLGRVWLRPESASSLAERRSLTGSRRRAEFRDGWAEFLRRKDARRAVELLNGRAMCGATRRGRWADDLWCVRFLPRYTWADLVEETCSGARERTLRVKAEVAAARRERAFVEERVAMAGRIEREEGGDRRPVRRFRQKRAIGKREWEEDVDERRAREAGERLEEEMDSGKGRRLDEDLVSKLFKRRKKDAN